MHAYVCIHIKMYKCGTLDAKGASRLGKPKVSLASSNYAQSSPGSEIDEVQRELRKLQEMWAA